MVSSPTSPAMKIGDFMDDDDVHDDATDLKDVILDDDDVPETKKERILRDDKDLDHDLDSKSSIDSIYSGVGDIEISSIALDSRRIFAEEFTKLKNIPLEGRTLAVIHDAVDRFRSLLLQSAYNAIITECMLSLLDARWMLPCLDEYPAYGIPLEDDCNKFAPYIMRQKLRIFPEFITSFVKRELVPKEIVPFYVESEEDHRHLNSLIEAVRTSMNNLMSVALESTYELGMPFRGVLGIDRSAARRVNESSHPIILPTAVFARTLLIHTDACGGETDKAGPFPCFDIYKQGQHDSRPSAGSAIAEESFDLPSQSSSQGLKAPTRHRCGLSSNRGQTKSLRVQLVDTHSLAEGVVLVGPTVMRELNVTEGSVAILQQIPPAMPRCIPRRSSRFR
eukprot:GEMP01036268.1.p1 GENE.GEMP01036268.1~~GEMP01036268.1.p1  ORF type:complete len:393 (+),score=73.18 GEMP01036268.1:24-1202(+)